MNCEDISLSTQTSNCSAVVRVGNILSTNITLKCTSRDVLSDSDLNQFSSYWWCLMYSDTRGKENTYAYILMSTELSLIELLQSAQCLGRCRSLVFDIIDDMTPRAQFIEDLWIILTEFTRLLSP